MDETTVTREIDAQGRVTIPEAARKRLGIDGKEVVAEITVRVDG